MRTLLIFSLVSFTCLEAAVHPDLRMACWLAVSRNAEIDEIAMKESLWARRDHLRELAQRMFGNLAHDANNALTVTMGNLELASAHLPPQSEPAKLLGTANAGNTTIQKLISRLLTPEQTFFESMLASPDQIVEALEPIFTELRQTLEIYAPEPQLVKAFPSVEGSVSAIASILTVLLTNAKEAIERTGSEPVITFKVAPAAGFLRFSVRDRAGGVRRPIEEIFLPYITDKPRGADKGTGLGLFSAEMLAIQHRGFIDVESVEGDGSEFSLYLPIVRIENPVTPEPIYRPRPKREKREGTIVVVEDEPGARQVFTEILRREGYTVHEFAQPEPALHFFQNSSDPVHFLLTDEDLQTGLGTELVQKVRVLRPTIKAAVMSGHGRPPALPKDLAFVPKPVPRDYLVEFVEAILRDQK